MEEYEINVVDGRNADYRTNRPTAPPVFGPTGTRVPVRTVYTQTAQPQMAVAPQVYYPAGYGPPTPAVGSNLFGRVTAGQVVDMVAQIFAALMPLPAAPVATSDVSTDVQNVITYQQAIAQYAKRDEQVRTLGNLIVKLIG
jgi:hypothetical protein